MVGRKRWWEKVLGLLILTFSQWLLLMAAYEFDQNTGASVSWIFCGIFMLAGTAVSFAMWMRWHSWIMPVFGAAFVVGILTLHFLDFTPAKPYKRFQAAIRNGMTAAEVRSALTHEFPQGGRFTMPTISAISADGMMILYADVRVAEPPLVLNLRKGRIVEYQTPHYSPLRWTRPGALPFLIPGPLLALLLCVKECFRAKRGPEEIGHGIDAGPVLERLQTVRGDYVGAHHVSSRELSWRRRLLLSARDVLSRLAFFQGPDG
jgi:hypothetical protein